MTVLDAGAEPGRPSVAGMLRAFVGGRSFMGRPYLISPLADAFCAGGGALLALGVFFLISPASGPQGINRDLVVQTAAVFAFMAYFVNYPHFMASYALLYGNLDRRMAPLGPGESLWWRYVNAAYVVPTALLLFFAWALWAQNFVALGYSIHAMYFFVGWHYVKQSYGVFVVLSAVKGVHYSRIEVLALKLHVYSLWLYTWYGSGSVVDWNQPPRPPTNFWGVNYPAIPLYKPDWLVTAMGWIVLVFALAAWAGIAWNWYRTGRRPSLTGLFGYTSMYTLLAFVRIHPLFTYAAPMFHSLQYMLFVAAYKRGEWAVEDAGEHHHHEAEGQRTPLMRWLTYLFLITATGALAFDVLPHYFASKAPRWGLTIPAIFMFHVFINTHHYFIDNVIWRRGNKDVNRYLAAK